jgi:glycogen synthase
MGGLGVMLTALAIAQTESPHQHISVIFPYYSFLRSEPLGDHIHPFARLQIPITSPKGKVKEVGCQISVVSWEYSSMIDFLNPDLEVDDERDKRSIAIYLVGPGDSSPFHVAFRAKDAGDVYSAYKPLKQEWKDLWFAKASAELVLHLNAGHHGSHKPVDVVHLHGATNAMVAYFLRQSAATSTTSNPPAIVYTLHDSLDEVEYSNLVSNAAVFLPPSPSSLTNLSYYVHGAQLFPSATGIDLADMVTFVSRPIAADIVEGRFTFALQDLVMPSIARRAEQGSFIGVTNGLDFTEQAKNPFVSALLVAKGLAFPRVGADLLHVETFWEFHEDAPEGHEHMKEWDATDDTGLTELEQYELDKVSEEAVGISFTHTKQRAKEHLVEILPSHFTQEDLFRPLLLFIGRFQYNKGCEFFEPIVELLASHDRPGGDPSLSGRLVVLGARNNYPIKSLRALQKRYPDHFTLIDDTTALQEAFGPLIRMAADFALVPSFSEAFGLVAAEGLLFGQEVISTGVGGLVEFLRPQTPGKEKEEQGNARLFQLFDGVGVGEGSGTPGGDLSLRADQARPAKDALQPAIRRCVKTVGEAIHAWRERKGWQWMEREKFVRRLVQDALNLKWDREHGPIEEVSR